MLKIRDILVQFTLALLGALGGMISGAVAVYFLVAMIYLTFFSDGQVQDSYDCARGMAVGYLSIFSGGILGASLGCYGALILLKSKE